jgi:hypothetical protein
LVTSFFGGVPPGVLIVGSVLNALGSFTELELVLELVVEVAGVVAAGAAAVAPPVGASTTPAALLDELALPPLELEPHAATTPPVAAARQMMVSVLRMNAAGE